MTAQRLRRLYPMARSRLGHQGWWPARTPFEMMLGAVLTQNTAWTNVEKAIANLRGAGALSPGGLLALQRNRLAEAIRPSGYFNQKARRLKGFARWFLRRFGGSAARMRREDTARLRGELLSLDGIGPETADSILLYALGRPVFVVDAYTRRILQRHGLASGRETYEEIRARFEAALPARSALFNDYHAQIVAIGKTFCRKGEPRCGECPWKKDLPGSNRPLPCTKSILRMPRPPCPPPSNATAGPRSSRSWPGRSTGRTTRPGSATSP